MVNEVPVKRSRYRFVPFLLLIAVVSLALALGFWLIVRHRQSASTSEYFSATGHNVQGDFLRFFRENGGIGVFGYPITEEYVRDGLTIQYFQNMLMEYHPEASPGERIRLTPIAEQMQLGEAALPASRAAPGGRYYAATGHSVGAEFLRFFDEHGGVKVFGYPITEAFEENGQLVQYFQNARMELLLGASQVRVAALGDSHFDFTGQDASLRREVAPARGPRSVSQIDRVSATVAKPYVWPPERQTLHVYVTDDAHADLAGAEVTYTLEYADGTTAARQRMAPTDGNGHSFATFDVRPMPLGQEVRINVVASYGGDEQATKTSFFLWP